MDAARRAATLAFAGAALAAASLVAGCGQPGPPSASPSGTPVPASAPVPSGSVVAVPRPTSWPREVANGVVSLGALQGDLGTAMGELSEAVAAEDLGEIRVVADRLATFLDRNLVHAKALQTEGFRDLGDPLVAAMTEMRDGAAAIRSAIDEGDGDAIAPAFQRLVAGMDAYSQVQPQVAALVPEALEQSGALLN